MPWLIERRRLADLYQAAFIEREELLRRGNELRNRKRNLQDQRDALIAQRKELAHQNTLRKRIVGFSAQVGATIDDLDFEQRQKLLRLVVEHVSVRGWRVEIQLRIPLDEPPTPPGRGTSSKDRLRSLSNARRRKLSTARGQGAGRQALQGPLATNRQIPFIVRTLPMNHHAPPLIAVPHDLSDEAAAKMLAFLYEIAHRLENHYADQLDRYHNRTDERQPDLWADTDPPF